MNSTIYKFVVSTIEGYESPRDDDVNLGVMHMTHKRYTLGDKDASLDALKLADYKLPVYGYDHGSLTIKTTPFNCPWDSGLLGFIYTTREEALSRGIKTEEEVMRQLREEVETYDHWLNGKVYAWTLYRWDGSGWDEIDGLSGYYRTKGNEEVLTADLPSEIEGAADLLNLNIKGEATCCVFEKLSVDGAVGAIYKCIWDYSKYKGDDR